MDDGVVSYVPLSGVGEVRSGDDLAGRLRAAFERSGRRFEDGDVLVVTQKIVSKAEGRTVRLADVQPSELAASWARAWNKDPRQIEVVLREARRIVRMERGVIIAETGHGFVCANAGVDASNVGRGVVSLLPRDPDRSAESIRRAIASATGARVGVVVTDTFGRAWRVGQTNVAIGAAGVEVLRRFQGQRDPYGYELRVTEIATIDELAGAAELVMGKTDRVPAVVVRGLARVVCEGAESAAALVRPAERDMFR